MTSLQGWFHGHAVHRVRIGNGDGSARAYTPGYRRFRYRTCGRQLNEQIGRLLNRIRYPSDVITLVVLWRLRCKLALQDLPKMFLARSLVFSHEARRDWKGNFPPL